MTNFNLRVSIVVPTRDRVEDLQRCLQGLSEQTFTGFEVLIVDDGSSSSTLEAYQELIGALGPQYRIVYANSSGSRRMGPSVVRNVGIENAKGDIVGFCDDDDYWCAPDLLEVAIRAFDMTGSCLYFGNQRIMRDDTTIASGSFKHVEQKLLLEHKLDELPVYQVDRDQILTYPDYAHLNITLVKRDLLEEIGGFWEETRYAEDVDLFVRLCSSAKRILFRPEVCSVHNAPVKNDRASASQSLVEVDRRLLENSVYLHLLATCSSPEAIRYASQSLSSSSKQLAHDLESISVRDASLIMARIAWAAEPSFKWLVYTAWLSFKKLIGH